MTLNLRVSLLLLPNPRTLGAVGDPVTVEALAVILDKTPRGVLIARDELAGWIGSFDQYKAGKGGADAAQWLEMHRAGTILVDRKTGDKRTLHVPRASVSISGNIQPGILAHALGREHFEDGLGARLFLAMPPRTRRVWSDAAIGRETWRLVNTIYDALLAIEFDQDENSKMVPVDLPLTPEGKAAWVEFYNSHGREMELLSGDLAAAWSKLEGGAARLAPGTISMQRRRDEPSNGGARNSALPSLRTST